jgi:hypothetical protein
VPQVNPHVVPSHDVWLAPDGMGHAVHDEPHELTLLFKLQRPPQLWLPVSHMLAQAMLLSMHALMHSFLPVGHDPEHAPFVHVGEPPVGVAQGVQDVPQDPTSVLLRHLPLQRW